MSTTATETLAHELEHFTGGDTRYGHWSRRLTFTDGAYLMAERCQAHWLIDAIASHQTAKLDERCDGFQLWTLTKREDGQWALQCFRDSGEAPSIEQIIEYSDFPLDSIRLYVEGEGAHRVLLLPSEH